MSDQRPKQTPEVHSDNMVWTRIFYGREVMERIIETISRKDELQQRYVWRYVLRAAMAGLIVTLMYVFTYQVKADLGELLNEGISKYITALTFSVALVFIYFTNSELLTSNFMYFTVGIYYRKIKYSHALRVLGLCLFGNILGISFIAGLVASCSIISPEMQQLLLHTIEVKQSVATHGRSLLKRSLLISLLTSSSLLRCNSAKIIAPKYLPCLRASQSLRIWALSTLLQIQLCLHSHFS